MERLRTIHQTVIVLCVGLFGMYPVALAAPLFNPQVPYSVGNGPSSVVIGNVNSDEDAYPDLAVANEIGHDVSVLLGNGDGTFQPEVRVSYPDETRPTSIAIGDLDGDDVLDLALANESSYDVSVDVTVLLGNGDGTFQPAANYAAGTSPSSIAIGYLDEDANLDLAVANSNSHDVSVLLGNGDGTFQAAVDYPVGSHPTSLATGDLNGDDDLDLAVANKFSSNVSVLLGNGDGTFEPAKNYGVDDFSFPSSVAIGDVNEDNNLDLVVAKELTHDVSVLLGNGNGTFQADVDHASGTSPLSVAVGDLDVDDNLDLVVANWGSNNVSVLLGNGNGTFQTAVSYGAGTNPESVAIGDLDGDDVLDLVVANYGADTVSVFINLKEACEDNDGDGYGFPADPSCAYPEEDCDDGNPDINPGADEPCNGVDDDCSEETADGADEEWLGVPCDGSDSDLCEEGEYECTEGEQTCTDTTEDDVEICDGLDNNCDLSVPGIEIDNDADHYVECLLWEGTDPNILGGLDCNDADPTIYRGAPDACDDEIDQSCDGIDGIFEICNNGEDDDCDGLVDRKDKEDCGYLAVPNAEASVYGKGSLAGSGVFNEVALILVPTGLVLFLRIVRRKK